jgi:hypothetical protein
MRGGGGPEPGTYARIEWRGISRVFLGGGGLWAMLQGRWRRRATCDALRDAPRLPIAAGKELNTRRKRNDDREARHGPGWGRKKD